MIAVYTYQDLLKVGDDERKKGQFALDVIFAHKGSQAYRDAETAQMYYEGKNTTIHSAVKVIYDDQGVAHIDKMSPNHKVASKFFGKVVDQKVEYLLGNGITFGQETDSIKARLGNIDGKVKDILRDSLISGKSYAFWNFDHVVHFPFREFAGLKDEENGVIRAGVRSWQLEPDRPEYLTMYEEDGFTVYIRGREGRGELEILHSKRPYNRIIRQSGIVVEEIQDGLNYSGFPIIPLTLNRKEESEFSYLRGTIDALDVVTSGMINTTADGTVIYWTVVGAAGMDAVNDLQFRDRIKTIGVVHVDDGQAVQSHVITPPVDGAGITRDVLIKKLYDDSGCFDSSAITAGNQTATAIHACYNNLNIEADKIEPRVTEFLTRLMAVAGIPFVAPTYTPDKIINTTEEIQSILSAAEYLSSDFVTEQILDKLGKQDRKKEVLAQLAAEGIGRFATGGTEQAEE